MSEVKESHFITRINDIRFVRNGNRKNVEKDLATIPTPITILAAVTDKPFSIVNHPVQ